MKFTFDQKSVKSCDKIKSCNKVEAADEGKPVDMQEVVDDKCDNLDDDFDYVLAGIDKLCREGSYQEALAIIETISVVLNEAIANIGDSFAVEEE